MVGRHEATGTEHRDQSNMIGREIMEYKDIVPGSEIENRPPAGGFLHGIARLLLFIVSAPFLAIRGVYWCIDTDAAIRANGVETTGTVLGTQTETRTYRNPEYSDESTVTEYFVNYRYESPEGSYTDRKKVGGLSGLTSGSKIVVYYLTRAGRPPESALDWCPSSLN